MRYKDFLKPAQIVQTNSQDLNERVQDEVLSHLENIDELDEQKQQNAEQLLRDAGFKIKLVTPTAFGTQVDLAKKYDNSDIEKTLNGMNIKIKGKSVFIVE